MTLRRLHQANSDVNPEKVNIIGVECDVSSEQAVQKAYAKIMATYGRIDSVVASAGLCANRLYAHYSNIFQVSSKTTRPLSTPLRHGCIPETDSAFLSYPFDRIKKLYDINVHGAFFTAREAARNMIPQGGGSIVLVASMSANVRFHDSFSFFFVLTLCADRQHPAGMFSAASDTSTDLSSLKHHTTPRKPVRAVVHPVQCILTAVAAVKHMASSLAVEWAKTGVRVNVLSPGYMLTKLTRTILAHDPELKVSSGILFRARCSSSVVPCRKHGRI